ncbi:MAG: hypothetical protein ABIC19_01650 [Patescibacteria group bacterium]|nr:hypothetical protein [Patescibacteria group bacterium]
MKIRKLNDYLKKNYRNFFLFSSINFFLFSLFLFREARSASVSATVRISVCGNGIAEYGEDCDNSDLDDKTCGSLSYDSGTLVCKADCSFDLSDCRRSGGGGSQEEEEESQDQEEEEEEEDETDNDNDNDEEDKKEKKVKEQPASVVGKIEMDSETRTLEVQGDSRTNYEDSHDPGRGSASIVVTDYAGNKAEIKVEARGDSFIIRQGELPVISQFSVVMDTDSGKLFILGPEGKTEMKVLPESIIEKVKSESEEQEIEKIELEEEEGGLVYTVSIRKQESFLGVLKVKIPSKLKYSLQDGRLVKVKKLFIWRVIDFLSF